MKGTDTQGMCGENVCISLRVKVPGSERSQTDFNY